MSTFTDCGGLIRTRSLAPAYFMGSEVTVYVPLVPTGNRPKRRRRRLIFSNRSGSATYGKNENS